ncbi:MAG: hypothetical protein GY761_16435 [Hyphomicrobiales bacterium]|nr:hypothetical protein [Hyphomicrobiales bacterium]
MSLDATERLNATFDLATLRHEAKMLQQKRQAEQQANGGDHDPSPQESEWRKLREIKESHDLAREDLEEHYRDTMDQRMEIARAEVQKTLTVINHQPRPPHELGAVRSAQFNNELIERRAEKLVERDLQRDMLKIDLSETQELRRHLEGPLASEYAQYREGQSYDTDRAREQDRREDSAQAQSQNPSQNRSLAQSFQPAR